MTKPYLKVVHAIRVTEEYLRDNPDSTNSTLRDLKVILNTNDFRTLKGRLRAMYRQLK